jgi:hypothetical protein
VTRHCGALPLIVRGAIPVSLGGACSLPAILPAILRAAPSPFTPTPVGSAVIPPPSAGERLHQVDCASKARHDLQTSLPDSNGVSDSTAVAVVETF